MDLYEKYIQLADNLGVDKASRLEWVQSREDREVERQEQKLERDEHTAKREAELAIQQEISKQKQFDAQAAAQPLSEGVRISFPKLKLPALTPSEYSDVDLFLEKFERTCSLLSYD
ncbi:hypothetical protein PoB_002478000 [Plakobranchus ocellatus]|uniref:Uncharacterized protein n=1 Tax=Plakobranchus ocellatus TaxID=259542 RepID=A0AAV3ZUF6_9GAST|nr:hypothetical protein PoB_002478000 [Plakobranchus ocellatus]